MEAGRNPACCDGSLDVSVSTSGAHTLPLVQYASTVANHLWPLDTRSPFDDHVALLQAGSPLQLFIGVD